MRKFLEGFLFKLFKMFPNFLKILYLEALKTFHTSPEYLAWKKHRAKVRGKFCSFLCGAHGFQLTFHRPYLFALFFVCFTRPALTFCSHICCFQVEYEKQLKTYHSSPAYLAYLSAKSKSKTGTSDLNCL